MSVALVDAAEREHGNGRGAASAGELIEALRRTFAGRGEDGPEDAEVGAGGGHLGGRVRAEGDEPEAERANTRSPHAARGQMHSIGVRGERDVWPIVDEERRGKARANFFQRSGPLEQRARGKLLAQLHRGRSARQHRERRLYGRRGVAVGRRDEIQPQHGAGLPRESSVIIFGRMRAIVLALLTACTTVHRVGPDPALSKMNYSEIHFRDGERARAQHAEVEGEGIVYWQDGVRERAPLEAVESVRWQSMESKTRGGLTGAGIGLLPGVAVGLVVLVIPDDCSPRSCFWPLSRPLLAGAVALGLGLPGLIIGSIIGSWFGYRDELQVNSARSHP